MREERAGGASSGLGRVRRSIEHWRHHHGGPGRPIPAGLWDEAVAVARIEGVDATARALRLDRGRLALRVARAAESLTHDEAASGEFVEIDARGLCAGQTVVRMVGRDGERLELTAGVVDVIDLARAFWARSR
jgi:hypothetical protein